MTYALDIGEMTVETPLASIKIVVGRTDRKARPVVEVTMHVIHHEDRPRRRIRVKQTEGISGQFREIVVTENARRSK